MPRNRSARAAVLGSSVQRPRLQPYPSHTSSAVKRRIVVGVLVVLSLSLITVSFRSSSALDAACRAPAPSVLRPFEVAANRVAQPVPRRRRLDRRASSTRKSENKKLQREIDDLRHQVYANQDAGAARTTQLREAAQLRRLAALPAGLRRRRAARDLAAAEHARADVVIAAGPRPRHPRSRTSVVTDDGLVGR